METQFSHVLLEGHVIVCVACIIAWLILEHIGFYFMYCGQCPLFVSKGVCV